MIFFEWFPDHSFPLFFYIINFELQILNYHCYQIAFRITSSLSFWHEIETLPCTILSLVCPKYPRPCQYISDKSSGYEQMPHNNSSQLTELQLYINNIAMFLVILILIYPRIKYDHCYTLIKWVTLFTSKISTKKKLHSLRLCYYIDSRAIYEPNKKSSLCFYPLTQDLAPLRTSLSILKPPSFLPRLHRLWLNPSLTPQYNTCLTYLKR